MNLLNDRVEAVFNAAVEKDTPTQRGAYLDGACGDDADLRMKVEALLDAHDKAGTFLVSPEVNDLEEGPGSRIGRFKILQKIGEGGFGVVYMAEQEEPIRRKVALKIIKLGMDTKQVIARFEAERQALALMEHANIAKVFDAGATETGRPYFVMELVKGVPITKYCDQHQLDTRERLQLFLDVCSAIQHAHQKGVIHRDLKPQNVMVTLHDGRPVPKVIDFGISKATNQRLTEKTLFTEYHQFIGTPQYMSPEQAEMSGLDIDTRSDVYSLGALLYELLTGTPPFEAKTLSEAGYLEIQRIIREVDPPKPSTRLATLIERDTDFAKRRGTESQLIPRLIQGDLDWIVMKAMEKDRTRRYGTAFEFAEDIRRFLNDEPVIAGAPSISYQARKFMLRHKVGIAASLAVVVALAVGCVAATIGFLQARHERDAAKAAKAEADKEAARSKEIADFLQDMLVATDPNHLSGVNVQQVVKTARRVFGDDHATVAATLSSRAAQLQATSNYEDAERLYRESIRIWADHYGGNHMTNSLTYSRLGTLLHLKGDEPEAEVAYRRSLEIAKANRKHESVTVADTLIGLADLLQNQSKFKEAERVLRESLRVRKKVAPYQSFQIAITWNLIANVLAVSGQKEKLEPVLEECLAAFKKSTSEGSNIVAKVHIGMGEIYLGQNKLEKSEQHLREALKIYKSSKTPSRLYRDIALQLLSTVIKRRDDGSDKFIAVRSEFLSDLRGHLDRNDPKLRKFIVRHAEYLLGKKRAMQALPLLVEAMGMHARAGDDTAKTSDTVKSLAFAAREIALQPGNSKAEYDSAIKATRAAIAQQGRRTELLVLRAMLEYRLHYYKASLVTLKSAEALRGKKNSKGLDAVDAIRAMAHYRLKNREQATTALNRFRAIMKRMNVADIKEMQALLREAEMLLQTPKS